MELMQLSIEQFESRRQSRYQRFLSAIGSSPVIMREQLTGLAHQSCQSSLSPTSASTPTIMLGEPNTSSQSSPAAILAFSVFDNPFPFAHNVA